MIATAQSARPSDDELALAYAQAFAENPHYPYESAEEALALRSRRDGSS